MFVYFVLINGGEGTKVHSLAKILSIFDLDRKNTGDRLTDITAAGIDITGIT